MADFTEITSNVITLDFQNLAFKRGDAVSFYNYRIKDSDLTDTISTYVCNHEGFVWDWDPLAKKFVIHTLAGEETLVPEEELTLLPDYITSGPQDYGLLEPPASSFYWIMALFITLIAALTVIGTLNNG